MNNQGFIFLLALGSMLLAGVVVVAHISAYRLSRRHAARLRAAADREPEFEFGDHAPGADLVEGITGRGTPARLRQPEHARAS